MMDADMPVVVVVVVVVDYGRWRRMDDVVEVNDARWMRVVIQHHYYQYQHDGDDWMDDEGMEYDHQYHYHHWM